MIIHRPNLITSRRKLITGAAALAVASTLPRTAQAATTLWDSTTLTSYAHLSTDFLTATNAQFSIVWCVDGTVSPVKVWQYNTATGKWNDDVIANQNPATDTGGYTPTGINAGPYFPMVLMQGASANAFRFGFTNATIPIIPSGFSAYDTAVGGTTTFDTSYNTQFTYSDGNLVATRVGAAGTQVIGRASQSFGSVKVCWAVHYLDVSNLYIGFGNSSLASTTYMHDATKNGVSSLGTYYFNNANSGVSSYGSTATSVSHITKGTVARNAGKLMFEVDLHYTTNAVEAAIGVGQETISTGVSPGSTGSWPYIRNSTIANRVLNGTTITGQDGVSNGGKFTIYVNLDASPRQLFYRGAGAGRYNSDNTADPVTGVGAIDISSLSGPLVPIFGNGASGLGAGLSKAANSNFAGGFSNSTPTGYVAWNDGPDVSSKRGKVRML